MLRITLAGALAVFPICLYLFDQVSPQILVVCFAGLAALRVLQVDGLSRTHRTLMTAGLVLFCSLALWQAALDSRLTLFKLYPVAINFAAAAYALHTWFYPPSAIARLATRFGARIEGPAVPYTRNLTLIWTLFFFSNGIIAAYTALLGTTRTWALYNGFISYVLIGLIFAIEYPIRRVYQRRHHQHPT